MSHYNVTQQHHHNNNITLEQQCHSNNNITLQRVTLQCHTTTTPAPFIPGVTTPVADHYTLHYLFLTLVTLITCFHCSIAQYILNTYIKFKPHTIYLSCLSQCLRYDTYYSLLSFPNLHSCLVILH